MNELYQTPLQSSVPYWLESQPWNDLKTLIEAFFEDWIIDIENKVRRCWILDDAPQTVIDLLFEELPIQPFLFSSQQKINYLRSYFEISAKHEKRVALESIKTIFDLEHLYLQRMRDTALYPYFYNAWSLRIHIAPYSEEKAEAVLRYAQFIVSAKRYFYMQVVPYYSEEFRKNEPLGHLFFTLEPEKTS